MFTANALQYQGALLAASGTLSRATAAANGTGFTAALDGASEISETDRAESYIAHLRSKYGPHFRIESIPRDPEILERVGKRMSGDDVIISPIVLDKMIEDPATAAYYERTIDHCFETVPQDKAYFASIGLTFEPCGVVVHDDGTVTYICGGGDTPERVAQVNAINAAKDARRAETRRQYIESSMEHAQQMREMFAERAEAQSARLGAMISVRTAVHFSADAAAFTPGTGPFTL